MIINKVCDTVLIDRTLGACFNPNQNSDSESKPSPSMLHPTHQARSRESLERLLVATEALLARGRTLEDLKVAEIAAEAGLSVGAFYARFKNKASLLPMLQTRYGEQVRELAPVYFAPERWAGRDLPGRVRLFVRLALRLYLRHRGLLRALAIDWRSWAPERIQATHSSRADFHQQLTGVFLPAADEVRHDDPERAVLAALLFFGATCRDVLLFSRPDHPHPVHLSEAELADQLARAFHAYLTTPAP